MFKLQRYFTVTSLVAFVLVAVLLGALYRRIILADLLAIAESKNVALTQAFSNSLWPQFAPFVAAAGEMSPEALASDPQTAALHQAVMEQMEGLSVVKIKVYNLDGLTVFSTEAAQIGEDKSENAGYLAARNGQVTSELTHRDTFSAFEQSIEDRDVFSSYIPIRRSGTGSPVEGVFEVYDDVTPLIQRLNASQRTIITGVTLILFTLYALLFLIVRRADGIIKEQYQALKEGEESLRLARDQAVEASSLKTQLLANVSHDLRTPLNAILGYSEMLQEGVFGRLTNRQERAAAEIIDSTVQLLNFVNNLLDQAQIDAGKIKLNLTPFQPSELVEDIEHLLGLMAELKGVRLTSKIDSEVPSMLLGDRYWLRQILVNLVSNALKFSDEGVVRLHILRPDTKHWSLQVTDTGRGIPPEAQSYIFDAFRQVDSRATREHTGAGLGLSIVKELTTIMGGNITLTSAVGQGSTFTVHLPLQAVEEVRA